MDNTEYYVNGCLYVGFTEELYVSKDMHESLRSNIGEEGQESLIEGRLKYKGTPILLEQGFTGFAIVLPAKSSTL